jgi:hypothetical protein
MEWQKNKREHKWVIVVITIIIIRGREVDNGRRE